MFQQETAVLPLGGPDSRDAPVDELVRSDDSLALTPSNCCLCGDVAAEPVAVAEDFDYRTSPDSFLVLRCTGCGCLYTSPAPGEDELQRIYPPRYFAEADPYGSRRARLPRWCRQAKPGARILDVGCGAGLRLRLLRKLKGGSWQLEGVESSEPAVQVARQAGLAVHHGRLEHLELGQERYDLVLLIGAAEHALDPIATLRSVRLLLRPSGRALMVAQNPASPSFALFGGRHWGAYDFPRQRRLFTADGLRRLAASADLEVTSLATAANAGTWTRSMHRLLQDWGAPAWLVHRFRAKSIAAAGFAAVEALQQLRGRGALLVVTLRRSGA